MVMVILVIIKVGDDHGGDYHVGDDRGGEDILPVVIMVMVVLLVVVMVIMMAVIVLMIKVVKTLRPPFPRAEPLVCKPCCSAPKQTFDDDLKNGPFLSLSLTSLDVP